LTKIYRQITTRQNNYTAKPFTHYIYIFNDTDIYIYIYIYIYIIKSISQFNTDNNIK